MGERIYAMRAALAFAILGDWWAVKMEFRKIFGIQAVSVMFPSEGQPLVWTGQEWETPWQLPE